MAFNTNDPAVIADKTVIVYDPVREGHYKVVAGKPVPVELVDAYQDQEGSKKGFKKAKA